MSWKGIVLAGGSGTRLYPLTLSTSKQLLPIYDKPMIYYPLSTLMLAGIREILIITTPQDLNSYKKLLGDGSRFGVNFEYQVQLNPEGLAQALIIGEDFIGDSNVCLILGDNLFHGQGLKDFLNKAMDTKEGATVFGYEVSNPEAFGIVNLGDDNQILSIEEKPVNPQSNIALTGLYFYDSEASQIAKGIKKSKRGELEITSVNQVYLNNKKLKFNLFGRGFAWLDTGTHDDLMAASQYIQIVEKRQGRKIACLEEIALRNGWLSIVQLEKFAIQFGKNDYGKYLDLVVKENNNKDKKL